MSAAIHHYTSIRNGYCVATTVLHPFTWLLLHEKWTSDPYRWRTGAAQDIFTIFCVSILWV